MALAAESAAGLPDRTIGRSLADQAPSSAVCLTELEHAPASGTIVSTVTLSRYVRQRRSRGLPIPLLSHHPPCATGRGFIRCHRYTTPPRYTAFSDLAALSDRVSQF